MTASIESSARRTQRTPRAILVLAHFFSSGRGVGG